jgi:hypothetical protein
MTSALIAVFGLVSCDREPEIGSPEWCQAQKQDGAMDDYTMNDVGQYAKHCMFSQVEE